MELIEVFAKKCESVFMKCYDRLIERQIIQAALNTKIQSLGLQVSILEL